MAVSMKSALRRDNDEAEKLSCCMAALVKSGPPQKNDQAIKVMAYGSTEESALWQNADECWRCQCMAA